MMKQALVTGGTGFVGSHVARRLLAEGVQVRCLVRPSSDRRNVSGLDVDIAVGDLLDGKSLNDAIRGCDALFHVAADYRLWVNDPVAMNRTNIEGSRALFDAAKKAGVERIVYTSSVAAV